MKKIIFLVLIIIIGISYFLVSSFFLPEEISEEKIVEKTSDKIIADGAKFSVEMVTKPIANIGVPIQFKVINGVVPPDPEICILNVTINNKTTLENETCVMENETLELIFDYEAKEDETLWNILVFYSINQSVKNITLSLKKEPAEEGKDLSLFLQLPNIVEKGKDITGKITFISDSVNWIKVEKAVLIIKKEDKYYKFDKILNYSVPPKFSHTMDYTTTLPAEVKTGTYTVQPIIYYIENNVEKAITVSESIEITVTSF